MRVVSIGRAVWLRDDERDGVYLAALVVTPQWACITAGSWTRDPGGGVRDRMWFCEFTAPDDPGASYKMGYNGAGTPQIQAGPFELAPQPPADVRWLDVTPGPGRPAVRADLTAPDLGNALRQFAEALNRLIAMLADSGRRKEALAAAREAVDVYRRLDTQYPHTAFEGDLILALNQLATKLSDLGSQRKPEPPLAKPTRYRETATPA